MSATLVLAVVLAVGCLAYVVYPLLGLRGSAPRPGSAPVAPSGGGSGPTRDVSDDEIEAAVRSYRASRSGIAACPTCGVRPEPDAVYCSSCGRRLSMGSDVAP